MFVVLVMFLFLIYHACIMNVYQNSSGWICPAHLHQRPQWRRSRRADVVSAAMRAGGLKPSGDQAFDDGWQREEEDLPVLKTHVTEEAARSDHCPQHLAGHLVRPLDQPLSRL